MQETRTPDSSPTKRARHQPAQFAAPPVSPAYMLHEVPLHSSDLKDALSFELRWGHGTSHLSRPRVCCSLAADVGGSESFYISNDHRIVRLHANGALDILLDDKGPRHTLIDTHAENRLASKAQDKCMAVVYEPRHGSVCRVAVRPSLSGSKAAQAKPERSDAKVLVIQLSEPYPKRDDVIAHGLNKGIIVRKSSTHLQLIEPGPNKGEQVALEVKSAQRGSTRFKIKNYTNSIVARPGTGEVYFLDEDGSCLYCWDTSDSSINQSRRVHCVASWEAQPEGSFGDEGKHSTICHIAMGPDYLLVYGGHSRSFRILRIELSSFSVQSIDLLSMNGALFRRHSQKWTGLVLSGNSLFLLVVDSPDKRGTTGLVEQVFVADLTNDEMASRVADQLQTIDWSGSMKEVEFRLKRDSGDEDVLRVDRRVLCARSEYFRSMFSHSLQENLDGVVHLPPSDDLKPFHCLMDYLYTDVLDPIKVLGLQAASLGELEPSELINCALLCLEVALLADMYQLLRLRRLAEVFVQVHALGLSTALPLLRKAHTARFEDLAETCFKYIARHWTDIKLSCKKELEQLVHDEPSLGFMLLMRCSIMK